MQTLDLYGARFHDILTTSTRFAWFGPQLAAFDVGILPNLGPTDP